MKMCLGKKVKRWGVVLSLAATTYANTPLHKRQYNPMYASGSHTPEFKRKVLSHFFQPIRWHRTKSRDKAAPRNPVVFLLKLILSVYI